MKRFLSAAALCVLCTSVYAANGVVISMKSTKGESTTTNQIQLDANHMRTEMAGRTGAQNTFVFDGVKQTMYIIDDSKKTYSEITKEDVDRVAAQLAPNPWPDRLGADDGDIVRAETLRQDGVHLLRDPLGTGGLRGYLRGSLHAQREVAVTPELLDLRITETSGI